MGGMARRGSARAVALAAGTGWETHIGQPRERVQDLSDGRHVSEPRPHYLGES